MNKQLAKHPLCCIVTSNKRCFMSKGKRYTQEFKEAAVKQITERGYPVAEVAERFFVPKRNITGGLVVN